MLGIKTYDIQIKTPTRKLASISFNVSHIVEDDKDVIFNDM